MNTYAQGRQRALPLPRATSLLVTSGVLASAIAAPLVHDIHSPSAPPAGPALLPMKLLAPRDVAVGHRVEVRGTDRSGRPGHDVVLQARVGGRWQTIARARTRAGGRFAASWHPRSAGRFALRLREPGESAGPQASPDRVTVYRPAVASWYGPGLWGSQLACGGSLTPDTIGVAHKTLPCGTRVTLRYGGRTITVPVIDRGPYVAGRTFDLTAATRERLGFTSVGLVWASA